MFARAIHNAKLIQLHRTHGIVLRSRYLGSDACGIPLKPTWSVKELLSSYPSPSVSPDKFKRLHELSALVPPTQSTAHYDTMKKELNELVKLVEAVKLVDIEVLPYSSIPDGRIWVEDTGIPLEDHGTEDEMQGTKLLRHTSNVVEDMYVVETDRER